MDGSTGSTDEPAVKKGDLDAGDLDASCHIFTRNGELPNLPVSPAMHCCHGVSFASVNVRRCMLQTGMYFWMKRYAPKMLKKQSKGFKKRLWHA